MSEHFDEYARIETTNAALVRELLDKIDEYVHSKKKVWSHFAGSDILKTWDRSPDWEQAAGDRSAGNRMFGVALWKHLTANGWQGDRSKNPAREYVVYTRP